MRNDFSFSNALYLFYRHVFKLESKIIDVKYLKDVVARKFPPRMQHDSHEFMMYLFSNLQDEETPVAGSRFDGSDENKRLEQVIVEYDQSHPSIIDKLFSGKYRYLLSYPCSRHAENGSIMRKMF